MSKRNVIALGQAGVDFVGREPNTSLQDMHTFEKAGGGTPANTAVGLAKLGIPVLFIGKVGNDSFGHFLAETLKFNGVDVSELIFDKTVKTTIGFESTLKNPELLIYGDPGPHILLKKEEINLSCFQNDTYLFLFGSMTLTHNPGREATFYAVDEALKKDIPVSFDPNLRISIWPSDREAKKTIRRALSKANIVKLSFDEYCFLSNYDDAEKMNDFRQTYNIDLLFVTSRKGCYYCSKKASSFVKGFEVEARDTTGAGDGFCTGFLYKILQLKAAQSQSLSNLSNEQLTSIATFGNASGALTTTKLGVIPALPTLEEINSFFMKQSKK
jgi:sugar/nucleoside kinase (ribokinase family)